MMIGIKIKKIKHNPIVIAKRFGNTSVICAANVSSLGTRCAFFKCFFAF